MPFDFDQYAPDSAFVKTVWRTHSGQAATFMSQAESHWELVVTKQEGKSTLTLKGPETKARLAPVPPDTEFIGIQLQYGCFMPQFPVNTLTNGGIDLTNANQNRFWLNGSALSYPDFDHADVFIQKLIHAGDLVKDSLVETVLNVEPLDVSVRTVQRRFKKATGMSANALFQIERSQKALHLLQSDLSLAEVAYEAGYADQAHFTRSLKHLMGQTPAQLRERSD